MIATAVVLLVGVWILSPRFDARFLSVIDDWSSWHNAPSSLRHLVHLDYDPAGVLDPKRYRPAYTAIWSSLAWHTFGAPRDLTGPNFWGVMRMALVLGALVWLVILAVPSDRRRSLLLPLLAAAAPLVVIVQFPNDFARLGPVEQNMLGGMIAGGLLMLFALRSWLLRRSRLAVAGGLIGGFVLWVFGVYNKEASICALALVPFLYMHLDRRWRKDGTLARPLWRERAFQVTAALFVLPLLHMLLEVKRIANSGETVYGSPIPKGTGGWAHRLKESFLGQWRGIDGLLVHPYGRALAIAASLAVLALWLQRRRVPCIEIGLVATAWLVMTFQGLGGTFATRYYLPVVALFAVALVVALAQSPMALRVFALLAVTVFLFSNAADSRTVVAGWAEEQNDVGASIEAAASYNPWRCPVYMSDLELEPAEAVPVLIQFAKHDLSMPCRPGYAGVLMLGRQARSAAATNEAIYDSCAKPGWKLIQRTPYFDIHGCRQWTSAKKLYGQKPSQILAEDRLVPGVRHSQRLEQYPRIGAPPAAG